MVLILINDQPVFKKEDGQNGLIIRIEDGKIISDKELKEILKSSKGKVSISV